MVVPQLLSTDPLFVAYVVVFAAAALGCLAGAWRAWQIESPDVRRGLVGLLGASGLWATAHVGMLLAPTLVLKTRFHEAGLVIGFATVWAWLWFCSAYSGRVLHRLHAARRGALLLFGAVALTKVTNPWHGLYFSAQVLEVPFPHLSVDHHALYWGTAALSYMLAAIGFFMLYESLRRVRAGAGRLAGLLGLTALPIAANAVGYATPWLLNVSHEPAGVAAFAVGVLFMYSERFEEASQVVRQEKPVLVLSETGHVRNYNDRAAALFPALEEERTVGRDLADLLPEVAETLEGASGLLSLGDGEEPQYYRLVESTFGTGAGRAGRLVVLEDVTEERRQQVALREQKRLLEQTQRLAGAWEVNLRTGESSGSEEFYRILEIEDGSGMGVEEGFQFFTPEARPKIREAFERCAEEGEPYDLELPVITAEGNRRWVRTVGAPAEEKNGEVVKVAGAVQDVTDRKEAERDLRRSRERYRSLFRDSNDAILVHDLEGRIREANPRAESLFGRGAGELKGQSVRDLYAPGEQDTAQKKLSSLRAGNTYQAVSRYERADGSAFWGEVTANVTDIGGETVVQTLIRDVTEREESRQRLERYREYTDRLLDAIDDLFFVLDEEGRFQRWNARFPEVTGYSDEEFEDMTAFDLIPEEDQERLATKLTQGFEKGHAQLEAPLVCKDGTKVPYEFMGNLVEHPDGDLYAVGIGRDITERKERASKLERSEQRYRTLAEHFPNGAVGVFDHDLRYTLAEGKLLGTRLPSADRLEGSRMTDIFPEETVADLEPLFRAAVEEGASDSVETTFDGRDWTVWATPLRDTDGEIFAGLSFAQDITERKQRQKTLERLNDLFAKAQSLANVGAWEYDVRADAAVWTDEVYRIHGLPPGAEIGPEKSLEYYHPDDRPRVKEAFTRAVEEGEAYEIKARLITEDGEQRWVRTRGEPQTSDGAVVRVRGTIRDVTDRERQEQSLRDRQEKVEALYETTNQLLQADDEEALGTLLVRLVDETLGYPATTIRLVQDDQLVPSQVPSTVRDHMPERPAYDIDGETPAAEAYQTGETRVYDDLSAVVESMERGDIRATAYVPIGSYGLISVGSLQVGGIDSFDLRLLEVLASYAALVLNRLEREEELLAAKVEAEHASQMKSTFLANMSHEIRTPLTSVIGFAEAIEDEVSELEDSMESPDLSALSQFAGLIEQSGRRLLETLDAVLNLSKLQAGEMELAAEAVGLAAEAEAAAERFEPQAREAGLTLRLDLDGSSSYARADTGGVQIVLHNLISNAIKYTEEGGVWIRTYEAEDAAVLEIEDSGIGMDPERMEDLFEPFRQESEGIGREYEGTGLGLTVTHRAVEEMGGTIEVDTERGEGTCVTVRLPRADAPSGNGA